MTEKKYTIRARKLTALPRNERRRLTPGGSVSGGGSTIVHIGSGDGTPDANSHTHDNKYYLDQITTDADDYLYLTQRHGEDQHIEKNKVKAGHADEAADLAPDAPARKEFLSRLKDDVAKGAITFEQMAVLLTGAVTRGIYSGSASGKQTFEPGGNTGKGFGLYIDEGGNAVLETDNIVARRKFTAKILEIQKELYAAGNINLTEANGTVAIAEKVPEGYKLYFRAVDNTMTMNDMWHNGDMALMQTINVSRGQRSYHRVVTAHGKETKNNLQYNYIVVSDNGGTISVTAEDGRVVNGVTGCDMQLRNSVPAEGDMVIQCGSVTETERMGLTRIDSRGNGYGGMYVYEGIGKRRGTPEQFAPTAEPIVITPRHTDVSADSIRLVTRNEHGEIDGSSDVGGMISAIDMKTDSIKLKVGLDGGRNLMKGTKHLDSENIVTVPDSTGSAAYKDFTVVSNEVTGEKYVNSIVYRNLTLEPSTVYALSFVYWSNPGTSFETYIYNADTRVCEYVKNNQTHKKTTEADGHSHFVVTDAEPHVGAVEFKTSADITAATEITVIVGRLMPMAGITNFGSFCAPKIEYGAEATQWRPSDDDSVTEGNLLDTGIDIGHRKITLTSDRVVVQNNKGMETAMIDADGKILTQLINADEVVTNGLKTKVIEAEDAVMDNINIMGNSRFGGFGVSAETPATMHNIDFAWDSGTGTRHEWKTTDRYRMNFQPDGLRFDYYVDKINNPQESAYRWCTLGSIGTTDNILGIYEGTDSPRYGNAPITGVMIDIAPTKTDYADNPQAPQNDALFIRHGTSCGIRFRTRRIVKKTDWDKEYLTWMDHTIILAEGAAVEFWLPPAGMTDDGQRIEIWCCGNVDNRIMCDDADLKDRHRVNNGQTKIYLYDKKHNTWWVRVM